MIIASFPRYIYVAWDFPPSFAGDLDDERHTVTPFCSQEAASSESSWSYTWAYPACQFIRHPKASLKCSTWSRQIPACLKMTYPKNNGSSLFSTWKHLLFHDTCTMCLPGFRRPAGIRSVCWSNSSDWERRLNAKTWRILHHLPSTSEIISYFNVAHPITYI